MDDGKDGVIYHDVIEILVLVLNRVLGVVVVAAAADVAVVVAAAAVAVVVVAAAATVVVVVHILLLLLFIYCCCHCCCCMHLVNALEEALGCSPYNATIQQQLLQWAPEKWYDLFQLQAGSSMMIQVTVLPYNGRCCRYCL